MQALVVNASAPGNVAIGEVDDPAPGTGEALVEVKAISLNRGEVRRLESQDDGHVPGWDVAGTVEEQAADGSGPAAGARVAGLVRSGAWAQRVAVPTSTLAELPKDLPFEQAAALPVAGLTALRTLRLGGLALERRVLVTGASGGVGRFAVQLAARAGAQVTAVVGSRQRGEGLAELGAEEIVVGFDEEGPPLDLVLESVGGASLAAALTRIAPGGTIVSFGNSSREPTTFDVSGFYGGASGARLYAYLVFADLERNGGGAEDLRTLAEMVVKDDLDSHVSLETSWRDAAEAIDALLERKIAGKAVLVLD